MTTLTMPVAAGRNFKTSRFQLETHTQRWESPLTRNVQRVLLGGARWRATYTLPKMTRAQFAEWQAFLMQCRGGVNPFYGYDPDARSPRGLATGNCLVNGGSQTGYSLIVDNLFGPGSVGAAKVLRAGDYIEVNTELKMLTQDVDSTVGGDATLYFEPALRSSPSDNATVTLFNPTCTMVLVDDNQTTWQTDSNGIYQEFTFNALEIF